MGDIAILYLERCSVRWYDQYPGAEVGGVRTCVNYPDVSSLSRHLFLLNLLSTQSHSTFQMIICIDFINTSSLSHYKIKCEVIF